jgi:hypothetical protein
MRTLFIFLFLLSTASSFSQISEDWYTSWDTPEIENGDRLLLPDLIKMTHLRSYPLDYNQLIEIGTLLESAHEYSIEVHSYVDAQENPEDNMAASIRMSHYIKKLLHAEFGLALERLTCHPHGAEQPIFSESLLATNASSAEDLNLKAALNQRVELVLIKK